MDPRLQRALEPILSDLGRAGLTPRLEDSDWTGDVDRPCVMAWSADGCGVGVSVDTDEPGSAQIVSVADQLQEWAIEDRWRRGESSNWPPCPEHPDGHPLAVVIREDASVWVCPASGRRVADVGALSGSGAERSRGGRIRG